MGDWSVEAGGMPAIITPRLLIVLDGDAAAATARRVWSAMDPDCTIEAALDLIVADGIAAAPGFVVAEFDDDDLVAVVRGDIRVAVTFDGDTLLPDGRSARTWRELRVRDVERLVVAVPGWSGDLTAAPTGLTSSRPGPLAISRVQWSRASTAPVTHRPAPTLDPARTRAAVLAAVEAGADPGRTLEFSDAVAPAAPHPLAAPPTEAIAPAAPQQPLTTAAAPASVTPSAYDSLFGTTINFAVEAAAVRRLDEEDDEDAAAAAPPDLDESSAGITGVVCPQGHANPLERATCRRCGAALTGTGVARVHRPDLGVVQLPDGSELPLDGIILVGRSPRAEHADGTGIPTLVTIDDRDVSRTHLRIRTEGWSVLVEDLGSTNGTMLTEPGGTSNRLRVGEPVIVSDGAVASMGDGARLTFRRVL